KPSMSYSHLCSESAELYPWIERQALNKGPSKVDKVSYRYGGSTNGVGSEYCPNMTPMPCVPKEEVTEYSRNHPLIANTAGPFTSAGPSYTAVGAGSGVTFFTAGTKAAEGEKEVVGAGATVKELCTWNPRPSLHMPLCRMSFGHSATFLAIIVPPSAFVAAESDNLRDVGACKRVGDEIQSKCGDMLVILSVRPEREGESVQCVFQCPMCLLSHNSLSPSASHMRGGYSENLSVAGLTLTDTPSGVDIILVQADGCTMIASMELTAASPASPFERLSLSRCLRLGPTFCPPECMGTPTCISTRLVSRSSLDLAICGTAPEGDSDSVACIVWRMSLPSEGESSVVTCSLMAHSHGGETVAEGERERRAKGGLCDVIPDITAFNKRAKAKRKRRASPKDGATQSHPPISALCLSSYTGGEREGSDTVEYALLTTSGSMFSLSLPLCDGGYAECGKIRELPTPPALSHTDRLTGGAQTESSVIALFPVTESQRQGERERVGVHAASGSVVGTLVLQRPVPTRGTPRVKKRVVGASPAVTSASSTTSRIFYRVADLVPSDGVSVISTLYSVSLPVSPEGTLAVGAALPTPTQPVLAPVTRTQDADSVEDEILPGLRVEREREGEGDGGQTRLGALVASIPPLRSGGEVTMRTVTIQPASTLSRLQRMVEKGDLAGYRATCDGSVQSEAARELGSVVITPTHPVEGDLKVVLLCHLLFDMLSRTLSDPTCHTTRSATPFEQIIPEVLLQDLSEDIPLCLALVCELLDRTPVSVLVSAMQSRESGSATSLTKRPLPESDAEAVVVTLLDCARSVAEPLYEFVLCDERDRRAASGEYPTPDSLSAALWGYVDTLSRLDSLYVSGGVDGARRLCDVSFETHLADGGIPVIGTPGAPEEHSAISPALSVGQSVTSALSVVSDSTRGTQLIAEATRLVNALEISQTSNADPVRDVFCSLLSLYPGLESDMEPVDTPMTEGEGRRVRGREVDRNTPLVTPSTVSATKGVVTVPDDILSLLARMVLARPTLLGLVSERMVLARPTLQRLVSERYDI
ncbi:hypothetical protein KIPB_007805, partial [Kipferlia bialata]